VGGSDPEARPTTGTQATSPDPVEPSARSFRVVGRVQGVGFRWWTQSLATRLDLTGWVRNAPDGSVQIIAAGPKESLEKFEQSLRAGPPGSTVEGVESSDSTERPRGPFLIRT
jgi:acylphosphatase